MAREQGGWGRPGEAGVCKERDLGHFRKVFSLFSREQGQDTILKKGRLFREEKELIP
jgi:hypothetical protein